jgi:hypothetical protein
LISGKYTARDQSGLLGAWRDILASKRHAQRFLELLFVKVGPSPKGTDKRAVHTRGYAKSVPGHHVQVDVKILTFKRIDCKKVWRFQYTAIDDATCVFV